MILMKFAKKLTILLVLLVSKGYSQSLNWAFNCGYSGNFTGLNWTPICTIEGTGVDNQNNFFISGRTWETSDFDPGAGSLIFTNSQSLWSTGYLAKYDMSGNVIWGFNLNNPTTGGAYGYYNSIHDLCIDQAGDVYVVLETQAQPSTPINIDLDPSSGVSNFSGRSCLAKYSSNGSFLWAVPAGYYDAPFDGPSMHMDSFGHIYIYGKASNALFCYDLTGTLLYSKSFGNYNNISDVLTDAAGNIYIAGRCTDTLDADWNSGVSNIIIPNNEKGVFISKYDINTNYIASMFISSMDDINLNSFILENNGNILIAGTYNDSITFHNSPGPVTMAADILNSTYTFVVKLDNNLNYEWGFPIGGQFSGSLNLDANNNLMLIGKALTNPVTVDWDPGSANVHLPWSSSIGIGTYNQNGVLLNLNYFWSTGTLTWGKQNDFYLTGNFSGTRSFASGYSLTANSYSDLFVARYSYSAPLSASEVLAPINFDVYPNPSTEGNFKINFYDPSQVKDVTISDMLGRTIACDVILEGNNLTVKANAPSGIYNVRLLLINGDTYYKRIVIN